MKKTSLTVKVLQAVGVYTFALIAAVACGPGFAPKQGSTTIGTPGEKPADPTVTPDDAPASFEPSGFIVKKEPGLITINFRDELQDVRVQLKRETVAPTFVGETTVGEAHYAFSAYCEDVYTAAPTQPGTSDVPATEPVPVQDSSYLAGAGMEKTDIELMREHQKSLEQNGQTMVEQGTTEQCVKLGLLIKKNDAQTSAAAFATQNNEMQVADVRHNVSYSSAEEALKNLSPETPAQVTGQQ